eukprot:COSAG01_NODE_19531_length_1004_cov_5.579006_1_plen_42_part_00
MLLLLLLLLLLPVRACASANFRRMIVAFVVAPSVLAPLRLG